MGLQYVMMVGLDLHVTKSLANLNVLTMENVTKELVFVILIGLVNIVI